MRGYTVRKKTSAAAIRFWARIWLYAAEPVLLQWPDNCTSHTVSGNTLRSRTSCCRAAESSTASLWSKYNRIERDCAVSSSGRPSRNSNPEIPFLAKHLIASKVSRMCEMPIRQADNLPVHGNQSPFAWDCAHCALNLSFFLLAIVLQNLRK